MEGTCQIMDTSGRSSELQLKRISSNVGDICRTSPADIGCSITDIVANMPHPKLPKSHQFRFIRVSRFSGTLKRNRKQCYL